MNAVEAAVQHAERQPKATRTRTLTWQDPLATAAAGAELSGEEYFAAIGRGDLPPPPMAVTMNMTPVLWSGGEAIFEGEPGEEHYNPIGVVHGGFAATLLDSALGCAVHTTLPAGAAYTTISLELKFVRPITSDTRPVRAEARVVHRGRTQATAEGSVVSVRDGKLLAHGTTTCLIRGEA